ncbi:hypothetical protein JCM8097_006020 [Rhodosporidiobolus ruineniae]
MSSLLALVLIAKSSLGSQLIYAYPSDPHAVPRTHKPVYRDARRQNAAFAGYASSSSDSDSSDSGFSDEDAHGADSKSYLGFPDSVLAALLSPNRELCDQPFELVVDHLAFVGHPVWLGDDGAERERRMSELKSGGSSETDDGDDEGDEHGDGRRGRSRVPKYADLSTLVIEDELLDPAAERDRTVGPPTSRNASAPPRPPLDDDRASSSSPRRPVDLARSQSSASTLHPGSSVASSSNSHNSLASASRLISFNFVCVIDTPPDSHLSSHLEGFHKDVVVPVTANVKALEKRELWLGKEAAKLRRMREVALEKGGGDDNWEDFLDSLPARSPLAAAISQLYTALKKDQLAEIHLGPLPVQVLHRGEIPVEDDFDARDREQYLLGGSGGLDGEDGDADVHDNRSRSVSPGGHAYGKQRPPPLFSRMRRRPRVRFQPWETLLLLEDTRTLQRDVPEGSLLSRFLEICRPTLSFAEYETLLDLDTEDQLLEDVVDHLVYWRKARVIDLISLKGSYAVSETFDMTRLPKLSALFTSTFPTLPPLPAFLASLVPLEPYSTLIPLSQRAAYLNALIFLLRHEVVAKQRTFVRVVATESVKRATALHWSGRPDAGSSVAPSQADKTPVLSTSLSGTSDHSFGGRSGRSRQSTCSAAARADLNDARGMSIVGEDDPAGETHYSPKESQLSRSAQSATMGSEKLRRRSGPTSHGQRSKGLSSAFSSHSQSERQDELQAGPSVIIEPGRPSMLESRWLSEMCRDKDKAVVQKFERIVRMLNGRHHLDEIRFRAQLSRKHLQQVLSAFEDNLILFTHA